MKRNCEICGSKYFDIIHKQKFVSKDNYLFSYNVVVCRLCGFTFASNLLSPKKLEKFYKENIKYAYQHNYGSLPEHVKKLHHDSFKMIDSFLKRYDPKFNKSTIRVLDIGCATGYLLGIFKKNQYKNLIGIDPSPECSITAKKLYKIKVLPLTLSEYKTKEKFDLIILASVIEHLSELENNLSKASSLLKEDGVMFISVPDGDNFGKILREPFLEFSLEHINYFTRRSLKNLLSKYGIMNIKYESYPLDIYGGYALNSLWIKNKLIKVTVFDKRGKNKILNYIGKSEKKLKNISSKINELVETQEEVIVWGVGSLTSRLLATTKLKKANIKYFVDSNTDLQGKKISGLYIKSPNEIKNTKASVLISTFIYGEEINHDLLNKYNFKGKAILL